MARGKEKSLLAVIWTPGGHTNLKKIGFVEAVFFSRFSESKRGVCGRVGPCKEMACGPLKEDNRRYLRVFSEVREEKKN